MALGLKQDVLESMCHTEHSNQMQMTKMLTEWLRRNYDTQRFGMPTWKKLVEAIKARTGGSNTALAQRIAEKHFGKKEMAHQVCMHLFPHGDAIVMGNMLFRQIGSHSHCGFFATYMRFTYTVMIASYPEPQPRVTPLSAQSKEE